MLPTCFPHSPLHSPTYKTEKYNGRTPNPFSLWHAFVNMQLDTPDDLYSVQPGNTTTTATTTTTLLLPSAGEL